MKINKIRTDILNTKWHELYQELRTDMESFRIQFLLTRKCKCKSAECTHYQEIRRKLFNNRLDGLLASKVLINTVNHQQIISQKQQLEL